MKLSAKSEEKRMQVLETRGKSGRYFFLDALGLFSCDFTLSLVLVLVLLLDLKHGLGIVLFDILVQIRTFLKRR